MGLKMCHSAYHQDLSLLVMGSSGEEPNGCPQVYTV